MRVIGIDPGQNGGIAVLDSDGELLLVVNMPCVDKKVSPQLIVDLLDAAVDGASVGDYDDYLIAVVEQVHSMPKQGVASSFNFGRSFGVVEGVLAGYGVRTEYVTPTKWKRAMGVTADKESSRLKAIQRWPGWAPCFKLKKHADRAEAALIALWWIESQK